MNELNGSRFVPAAVDPSRGRSYRAGFPADFGPGVFGTWRYLQAATRWPVELELLPDLPAGVPSIADFPEFASVAEDREASALTLLTSGTTGEPKPVRIEIADRFARTRGGSPDARWILAYAPFRWAGVSVLLHALRSQCRVVVPRSLAAEDIIAAMVEGRTTHASWTPSLFRRLQLGSTSKQLRAIPLRQVTFGGEYATQDVLDRAAGLWPEARITHVYATTEFGDLWAVSDGREGCPAGRFLREDLELSVEGELLVGGRPTGDYWVLRQDRYMHTGRREDIINVGGAKVAALAVEAVALSLDGVEDARVYAIPSPVLGQLVGLEYVGNVDEQRVRRLLGERLSNVERPAEIIRTQTITLSSAYKKRRSDQRA